MKTTDKQFKLFKGECEKWIDKFKLDNCRVTIILNDLGLYVGARCNRDILNSSYTVALSRNTAFKMDDKDIREHAKHEIIHVLLGKLSVLGCSRFVDEHELEREEEELVRKLENIIN